MTTNTPLSPTARQLWLRTRWFLAGGAVLLLAGLLVAGLGDNTSYPSLDPRSPDADGTRAAVQLLRQRGITVTTTGNPADLAAADAPSGGDTVVVPLPDLLTADQLDALGRAGHRRLVLVSPAPSRSATSPPASRPSAPPTTRWHSARPAPTPTAPWPRPSGPATPRAAGGSTRPARAPPRATRAPATPRWSARPAEAAAR